MIYCIKRKDLDVEKYDACIAASVQFRIYAFSWYLDAVSKNWEVLILNDYEAVMPLPWKQKYFLKYITQPFFCQQLGIFSLVPITIGIQENMIRRIPNKFIRTSINFNSDNFLNSNMKLKKNALLTIENAYENIYKKFNKNRKRALKKASSLGFTFEENIAPNEFYDFYVLNDKNHLTHISMKKVLQNILNLKTRAVQCYGVKSNTVLINVKLNTRQFLLHLETLRLSPSSQFAGHTSPFVCTCEYASIKRKNSFTFLPTGI